MKIYLINFFAKNFILQNLIVILIFNFMEKRKNIIKNPKCKKRYFKNKWTF